MQGANPEHDLQEGDLNDLGRKKVKLN
ncbi:hypothetical protein Nmel_014989 [Mimus melanotis]